jgi:hypothetical protein
VVYEFQCQTEACSERGITKDSYVSRFDSPSPPCPVCREQLVRVMLTPPKAIYLGSIGRFGDPSKEGYDPDGFTAYRVNSSRNADGSPEAVRITTRQEQVAFARDEGLRLPDDMNPNAELSKDGKRFSTSGVSGQWSGVPSQLVNDDGTGHLAGWV